MPIVKIYGCSDDLIELEGDITEEFDAYCVYKYLHFSDGTIVKIGYDQVPDKGWDIEVVQLGPGAILRPQSPETEGGQHFSDVIHIEFPSLPTVELWSTQDGPDFCDMEHWFDSVFEVNNFTLSQLRAAYRALN